MAIFRLFGNAKLPILERFIAVRRACLLRKKGMIFLLDKNIKESSWLKERHIEDFCIIYISCKLCID